MRRHDLYKRGRGCPLSCLSFGEHRKTEYPDFFFCHGCDLLEDAVKNGAKRAHREQKKYVCTAGHTDLLHPTTTKKQYRPNLKAPPASTASISISEAAVTQHHQESRRKDDGLFSTKTVSSQISPCKKKQRRDLEESTPEILQNANLCWHGDQDKGTLESSGIAPFVVTPSPGGLSRESFFIKEKELMECIESLKIKNILLEKKIAELDSSKVNLTSQVEILSLQMEGLQFPTPRREACNSTRSTTRPENHSSDNTDNDDGGRSTPQQGRRHRIQVENDEISEKLALTINDFVKRTLSNRSKFPTSRIARILIESVLSFEWTHSEFARVSSKQGAVRDSFGEALTPLLNVVAMKRHSHKSKAALLVECMWDDSFLDGEVKERMITKVRSYLRSHIFTPWKILKGMDLAGFNLSLSGLEVLRRVDIGTGKFKRGILPSKSTMLRTARRLEFAAVSFCPFQMIGRGSSSTSEGGGDTEQAQQQDIVCLEDDTFGEGFEFDCTKVTRTPFEAFGLMDVAKQRPVELGLTSDGAQLTNTISHVAAGLKFNDMALCHPISKCPLLLHEPGSLVQSRNLCFPLRIVIAKDSKKTLDGFRPLYLKFSTGEIARDLQCHAFKMSFPGDMKLQWGALDAGGAAKVKENFCFACSCRSSTLHVPRDKTACNLCEDQEGDNNNDNNNTTRMQYCYHYPFLADPQIRTKLADELGILTASLQDNDEHGAAGKDDMNQKTMYVRRPNEVMTEGDAFDIDCQTGQSNSLRALWARNITDELSRRGMAVRGTLTERQQRLRQRLVSEQRAQDISTMLADSEPKDRAMYLALQGVVCILHLENRVGLKSIESILRSGLSNAKKGVLSWTVAKGVSRRQEEYIRRITSIMQTEILGTAFAPSQWRFPLTEDGNMGRLSMDNNRTRRVVNAIELLIDASFHDTDNTRDLLLQCFPHYRAALLILRKDTDDTEEEVRTFQNHIDLWFSGWVQAFGKEGCTNYTHMLSSSHVMRYMQEWKCLNRFSQQGWEALNALIKSYFFRRTNRGGLSKNSKNKSKLLGIARWLQRRIMWYSGNGDLLFCDNEDDADDSLYEDNDEVSSTSTDTGSKNDCNFDDNSSIQSMDSADSDDEDGDDNDSLMSGTN